MTSKDAEEQVTHATEKRWPTLLIIAASVYACWLSWLAYLAWVNVQSGNQ